MTTNPARSKWRRLLASACLLASGACTHATTSRPAADAPPLRYTHATAHSLVAHGDGAVHAYALHFELTNTWARSLQLQGIQGEPDFIVPHQAASFLRERADGAWGDIEEAFVEPVLARDRVTVPRNGRVQVLVPWFGNEALMGEPLRACLELSEARSICSEPFVVEGVAAGSAPADSAFGQR
jgi:hypothetical protein